MYVSPRASSVELNSHHRPSVHNRMMSPMRTGTLFDTSIAGSAKPPRQLKILKPKPKLSTSMSLNQFDNGYWYATELKWFAETIGIPAASKLRKDELEKAIEARLIKNDRSKENAQRGKRLWRRIREQKTLAYYTGASSGEGRAALDPNRNSNR